MNRIILCSLLLVLMIKCDMCFAQSGPRVPPCEGCPTSSERPFPRSGFWFDPGRSGTGFTFEVQRGIIGGAYYGFDPAGARTWFIFSGALEPSVAPGEYWSMEADLLEFTGGACIDCDYQPNLPPQVRHRLRLSVLQRNLIAYSIDGGPEFRVQPLVWGTQMNQLAPSYSDFGLPTFPSVNFFSGALFPEGAGFTPWIITIRDPSDSQRNLANYLFPLNLRWTVGFLQSEAPGRPMLSAQVQFPRGTTESVTNVFVTCNDKEGFLAGAVPASVLQGIGAGVFCMVRIPGTGVEQFDYFFGPLGNVGDDYFFATAPDGRVIEGVRLLYR